MFVAPSFESLFTENGVEDAIPFNREFELEVVVVVDDEVGTEFARVNDFLDGSWLCERFIRDVGDVGDKFVNVSLLDAVVVVDAPVAATVLGEGFSNREIRPREPSVTLLFGNVIADCWAFSCNFWSSDRCDSSICVDWYDVFGTKSFESSRISTSFVS